MFPDPRDRSPNNPYIILTEKEVLRIYKEENPNEIPFFLLNDLLKEWVTKEAEKRGWSVVEFVGIENKVVLLGASFIERFSDNKRSVSTGISYCIFQHPLPNH